ncbi:hypothetical protein SSPO_027110 [Streptomyces antimycoticus]|uniref:Uncharacterized protein n=1 Tax=Streptomyces antimycoticus TaxID=68175 RepID=A0A499UF90_9ACTN|nr:hypothetical protein SSPO_027110 [Streptomyces antimycoticus]
MIHDKLTLVLATTDLQDVEADWEVRGGRVEDDHVLRPVCQYAGQDFGHKIALGVEQYKAVTALDVLKRRVGDERGLADARRPDEMQMPQAVFGREDEGPIVGTGKVAVS